MTEKTSAEMAGGIAVGMTGHIHGFNADAEARLDAMMMEVGKWIYTEAGMFLGHVKMSVTKDGKGITLNLTNLDTGVEHHNSLSPCPVADFNFMAAVLDVDDEKLEHRILHAMEDSGVDICIDGDGHEHHHHDHDCNCSCHKH